MILGADAHCDVVVGDPSVESKQACAWSEDGQVVVSILGTSAPVLLDGRRVVARSAAGSGALLKLGDAAPLELVLASGEDRQFVVTARCVPELGILLEEPGGERRLELTEGRTAELGYLLARRTLEDEVRGAPPQDAGWVDDHELAGRLWGVRSKLTSANKNSLNVCVFRLRAQLAMAGFSRDLVEKRQRRTRFRPDAVGAAGAT
ncbi:MAG: FHA domain-containing protein [Proteobacteria bacterium]|nr:FHA domain-containing protein [Pseudomonadota bacterium]MCP4922229.1 FHA domain-containing protein [Pseudomonadota bacterium]